jgi:hypothetical protein
MRRSLLVYDGSNRLFRAAADALARRPDLEPVPWGDDAVQSFLEAQFGARPFVFALVEDDGVHVGDAAVARLLRRRGVGRTVTAALERAYPGVAGPFGRLVHGREPADIHGSFPLDEAAAAHLEPLRRVRTVPVEEA